MLLLLIEKSDLAIPLRANAASCSCGAALSSSMTGGQERDKKGYLKSACSLCSGRCTGRQLCDLLESSSPVTELDVTDRALCPQHSMSQVIYMGLFSLEEAQGAPHCSPQPSKRRMQWGGDRSFVPSLSQDGRFGNIWKIFPC